MLATGNSGGLCMLIARIKFGFLICIIYTNVRRIVGYTHLVPKNVFSCFVIALLGRDLSNQETWIHILFFCSEKGGDKEKGDSEGEVSTFHQMCHISWKVISRMRKIHFYMGGGGRSNSKCKIISREIDALTPCWHQKNIKDQEKEVKINYKEYEKSLNTCTIRDQLILELWTERLNYWVRRWKHERIADIRDVTNYFWGI